MNIYIRALIIYNNNQNSMRVCIDDTAIVSWYSEAIEPQRTDGQQQNKIQTTATTKRYIYMLCNIHSYINI